MSTLRIIRQLPERVQDWPRFTMHTLWILLDRKEEGPNLEVAARTVCKSAANHLFYNFPHGGDGIAPATAQLLELSRKTVVAFVPDSAIYKTDDEKRNDALWHAIANRMSEDSLTLFNTAIISNLSRVTRHDIWSRSLEKALESLIILNQIVEMETGDGRVQ